MIVVYYLDAVNGGSGHTRLRDLPELISWLEERPGTLIRKLELRDPDISKLPKFRKKREFPSALSLKR